MRAPPLLSFIPLLGVLALGCTGGGGDTGWWIDDPDSGAEEGDFFEPDAFFVETYAAYGGDRLEEFILDPNDPASALPPVMMITFAENRYFSTGNDAYTCSWFGMINVEGIDMLDDPDLWVGYAISLDFLETTCDNMDPWVWGDRNPTQVLETAFLGIGFRPMSLTFERVIKEQVAGATSRWEQDWKPYVFTMVMGIWDEGSGRLMGTEVDYAFTYQMIDGALSYDYQGDPMPLKLEDHEGLPQGLVAGYPYYDMEPGALR